MTRKEERGRALSRSRSLFSPPSKFAAREMSWRRSLLLLCTVAHATGDDSVAAERTRRAAYTRCLRHCELSAQTTKLPNEAQLKHCYQTRCKSLQPNYSVEVPPLLSKDEL